MFCQHRSNIDQEFKSIIALFSEMLRERLTEQQQLGRALHHPDPLDRNANVQLSRNT